MKKKLLTASLTGTLLIAFPTVTYLSSSFTPDEVVEQIQDNDRNQQKTAVKPKIDSDVQMYQAEFQDDLEDLQDLGSAYQTQMQNINKELQAYNSVYNYWALNEQARISQEGLKLAEKQMTILNVQYEQGLVSEGQLIEMEQSINNQKAQNRSLEQQLNTMKFMLNQDLDQPLKNELAVSAPSFAKLPASSYKADTVSEQMKEDHESLLVPRTTVSTYEDILDDVDDLEAITGPSTSQLRSARSNLNDQIETKKTSLEEKAATLEEKKASIDSDSDSFVDPSTEEKAIIQKEIQLLSQEIRDLSQDIGMLETQKSSLDFQIGMMEAQDPDVASTYTAEKQLTDYYSDMLRDARIDLSNQKEAIELMAYQYEEQFTSLTDQLALLEENRDLASDLYDKEVARLEQGVSTQSAVDQARQSLEQAKVEIVQLQKDYMLAKKEFELFTEEGYLPQQ